MKKLITAVSVTMSALVLFGASSAYAITGADPIGGSTTVTGDTYIVTPGGEKIYPMGTQPINLGSQTQTQVSQITQSSDSQMTNLVAQTQNQVGQSSQISNSGQVSTKTITPEPSAKEPNATAFKIGSGNYSINGYVKQDVAPYIENGRTLMPLRYVAYANGIGDNSIYWNVGSQTAYLEKKTATNDQLVVVKIGDPSLQVIDVNNPANDKTISLDVPAEIKDGRTMIPLRAVSEAFGCQVQWDGQKQVVTIVSQ